MKNYFKTNPVTIIFVYLIVYIFGALLASVVVSMIAANVFSITVPEAFKILALSTKEVASQGKENIYYFVQSWSNFITYVVLFILVVFFARGYFKEDLKKFSKKNILIIVISAILFAALSQGMNHLASFLNQKITGSSVTSENEVLIEKMILSGYKVPMFLSVALFAPVVEELVYRKALIELSQKLPKWAYYLIISFIFAILHMTSSFGIHFGVWIILFLVYFISSLLLILIYELTNKNIYSSIFVHMVNNIVSFIFIVSK